MDLREIIESFAELSILVAGDPMTDVVIPIAQTGMDNFLWFRNPYDMEQEPEDPKTVESTEGYLLAYWVGRYFGFITPDM